MSRPCPICADAAENATLFVKRNIDPAKLSAFSFSSRKEPEFMSHRLVQCRTCDLVYVPEPPQDGELANAYHVADYDSAAEALDAATTYIGAIAPTLAALKQQHDALEIGAGNGIFLTQLAERGFTNLYGIEPSAAAIAAAPAELQAWLHQGVFLESDFAPSSFDLICCFMTMEHVPDPHLIARACHRLLRPGGAFVTVTHDYRSLVNRVLGKRSPIIDIEHMQLFSKRSIEQLLIRTGYASIGVVPIANTYTIRYWLRLFPLPKAMKRLIATCLEILRLDGIKLSVNVGNQMAVGFKPSSGEAALR